MRKKDLEFPFYFDQNEVIKKAMNLIDQGYSVPNVAKFYNLDPKTIYYIVKKRLNGKKEILEKAGRKSKIKQIFLDFLERFLKNIKYATSPTELKRLLVTKFHLEEKDI